MSEQDNAGEARVMTLEDLQTMMVRVFQSIDAGDTKAAAEAFDFDPCRVNVGMTLRALAASAGTILRNAASTQLGGETFARPQFEPGASEATYWGGRMFAVAINDDRDTLDALVEACLNRAEQLPEREGGDMVAEVLFMLVQALAAALHQHNRHTKEGKR